MTQLDQSCYNIDMTNALRNTVVDFTADENTPPRLDNAERDAEICRLWQAQWTGRKIAEHLGVPAHTIAYVVRKNGLTRKPRDIVQTVALADAPVEAWQQAVLPELQQAAEADGLTDAWQRAFIIVVLLRLKPYASLAEFETWARQVTGYDPAEIALFLQRAKDGHIVCEDGQPDALAYKLVDEPENCDIAASIMAGVLLGKFNRTADDMITAAPDQLPNPDSSMPVCAAVDHPASSEPHE
jgi:hypothetical protein